MAGAEVAGTERGYFCLLLRMNRYTIWQGKKERCSLARTTLRPNLSAVLCDNSLNRGKTNTRAGVFRLLMQSLEGAEQFFCVLHFEPSTIVLDEEDASARFALFLADYDVSMIALRGEFPRI